MGSSLSIAIKKCQGTKCRTPQELEDYAKTYSFTSISNYNEYQPSKYGEETIKRTIKSDPLVPLDLAGDARFFVIKNNVVISKEDLLGLTLPFSSLTAKNFYTTELVSMSKAGFHTDQLMEFVFMQAEETRYFERSVYTWLDLLGDVGGLKDALVAIVQIFLFLVHFITKTGPHNYIL